MARHFACVFLLTFLCSAGANAATPCDQQRGDDAKKGEPSRQGEPSRMKWWLHSDSRKELRLTDQQSKKIDEIWESTAPKLRETWQEREKLEEALAKMIKDTTADVAVVAPLVERVERLRAENSTLRIVMLYKMRLLLTPEQRPKVDAIRAKMEEERKRQDEERKRQGKHHDSR